MQRVFELISSVIGMVDNVKATAKKVCRNIIITMATVISILTMIIVVMVIEGEKTQVAATDAAQSTEAVQDKNETGSGEIQVVDGDATSKTGAAKEAEKITEVIETTEVTTETEVLAEKEAEEETTLYLSNVEIEEKDIVTATYAPAEIYYTEADYDALLRIVHAEAGNQDDIGKILVANVIINRVKSDIYPNDIYSVITQRNGSIVQFSPTMDGGSFYTIQPTGHTKQCVDRALAGEDYSMGALYFCRETSPYSWFNTKLTFLFTHGPHYFYK